MFNELTHLYSTMNWKSITLDLVIPIHVNQIVWPFAMIFSSYESVPTSCFNTLWVQQPQLIKNGISARQNQQRAIIASYAQLVRDLLTPKCNAIYIKGGTRSYHTPLLFHSTVCLCFMHFCCELTIQMIIPIQPNWTVNI